MSNSEFGISEGNERIKLSDFGKGAAVQALHFGGAALLAAVSKEQFFSPLGVAFCSGTSRKYTLISCLGAMLGYIISKDYLTAFRYVMTLIIVYILKVYIHSFPSLREKVLPSPLIALFSTAATGIIVTVTSPFDAQQLFLRVAEFITSFGGAYFFTVGFMSVERLRKGSNLLPRELISLVISALIVVLSMSKIAISGVSLSGIICSYAVMCAAYLFRESGGAIIGTGASLGFVMAGNSMPTVFCYSAAGLFSGLFSYSGRVLCAMAYIFSYGAMFLFFGGTGENVAPLIESAIGSVIFIITPQKTFFNIKLKFSGSYGSGEGTAVRNIFMSRLKMVRDAVGNMSGTVSKVSEILKEKAAPDTAGVYLRVRDKVCSGCASYDKCWHSGFPGTVSEFDAVIEEIRKTGSVTPSSSPSSLQSRCIRIMSLCDSFNRNYSSYSARLGAEGRINEMRKITADQFDTVCDMIDDLILDFESGVKPLASRGEALKSGLADIGVASFVNCYEDEGMNTLVNVSFDSSCKVSIDEIKSRIESITEKEFAEPARINSDTETMLMFWEKPIFSAECVYHQMPSEEGDICGDCFDSFFDGRGNFVAVLSDGMGTGSRAAIDGAMASALFSKLIISGFSFPCALRLVNSAMLVKSSEESLATLDILKVNLYTGQAVVYKAGATVSLLKRQGKVSEIKKSAMPIGILRQVEFATVRGGLKNGDVIVMMSDGAADNSIDEIKKYMGENSFSYDLAEKLCMLAKSRNIGKCDDITVAAVKIKRNEKNE